jgi:HAMP domain-containing protein
MEEITIGMIVVTLWETFGWLTVFGAVVAIAMLFLLFKAISRRRAQRQAVAGLFWRGVLVMLIAAAVLTPFVPLWTLAPVGDLHGLVDYVIAYSMALAPGALIGVLWIYFASFKAPQTV